MKTDYLIIGSGIIGLTTAYYLKQKHPHKSILIIDKENDVATHASGRNSGVLHAGLYYATDSLRAKYCTLGLKKIKEYSKLKNIPINECGKVVVAINEQEIPQLHALYKRALANGVDAKLVDTKQLTEIEPNAKTCDFAIYSPATASFYHKGICNNLKQDLLSLGIVFNFNTIFKSKITDNSIETNSGIFEYNTLINCGGMYADKIAQNFGLLNGKFTLIPFKGVFLNAVDLSGNYSKHIYPLPDQKLKFLGVHFSPDYTGNIKVGPTAVPCLARENYSWLSNLRFNEMKEIISNEFKLFMSNNFNFRDLVITELKKQSKSGLISYAANLVKDINQFKFTSWGIPGIQPRLYDMDNQEIIDDFMVLKGLNSIHIVNSVSPAFTASFAFSEFVVNTYL